MKVRANLRASAIAGFSQDVGRPRLHGDLVGGEIGRPNTQAVEEPSQSPELPDVLHRDSRPRRDPVVLLGVQRDDEQHNATRARRGRGHLSPSSRRLPGLLAHRLPSRSVPARHCAEGGVERRQLAEHDVGGHRDQLRVLATLRPPPSERRAEPRQPCESQGPAGPRRARDEARQRRERQHADVRHEPATHFVGGQDPCERPVAERVQQLALDGEGVPAPSDGADLAPVLVPQRRRTGFKADGVRDGDRPKASLPRDQGGSEVPAQAAGKDVLLDRRPRRVEPADCYDDPAEPRLQVAHPHLVVEVRRLAPVGVGIDPPDAHAGARGDTHSGVCKARDQPFQRPRVEPRGGVAIHDDVSVQQTQGFVFCRCLPSAARHAHELNTVAGVLTHDRIGAIGRGVGQHQDLPPVCGIVEL